MIKQLKAFTVNMVAGANVAVVALMLLTGYSDWIDPVRFPRLSTIGMTFPILLLANLGFLVFWLLFKWRRAWIPVAGYLLAYVPINIYMPLNMRSDVPDGAIKLLSYNICDYGGNYKYDDGFGAVFDYLARQNADIVCLQEDVDSWRRYVFQRYQQLYAYNDTTLFLVPGGDLNAVGIHSKYPILRKERLPYASRANGSVAYFVQIGADTVVIINNHLEATHLADSDRTHYRELLRGGMERRAARKESMYLLDRLGRSNALRAQQARVVHDYVKRYERYPVIVCGDFNDNPISYSRRVIADGLTDCFRQTGKGIGLSYNQKGFYFRIDHIFCSSRFEPYNCHVDNKIDASDHYPIICWLKMRDKP